MAVVDAWGVGVPDEGEDVGAAPDAEPDASRGPLFPPAAALAALRDALVAFVDGETRTPHPHESREAAAGDGAPCPPSPHALFSPHNPSPSALSPPCHPRVFPASSLPLAASALPSPTLLGFLLGYPVLYAPSSSADATLVAKRLSEQGVRRVELGAAFLPGRAPGQSRAPREPSSPALATCDAANAYSVPRNAARKPKVAEAERTFLDQGRKNARRAGDAWNLIVCAARDLDPGRVTM